MLRKCSAKKSFVPTSSVLSLSKEKLRYNKFTILTKDPLRFHSENPLSGKKQVILLAHVNGDSMSADITFPKYARNIYFVKCLSHILHATFLDTK